MAITRLAGVLCVLLTLATPSFADDFGISGANVAGTANILYSGRVMLRFQVFNRGDGTEWSLDARVVRRTATALTITYERQVAVERGLVALGSAGSTQRKEFTVTLTATESGFSGKIEGIPQTWVRQDAMRGATVLIVPGVDPLDDSLFTRFREGLRGDETLKEKSYLHENRLALINRGFPTQVVRFTTGPIATNAIAAAVRARGEVFILAHGAGATAAIAMLSDPANRDLLPKVRGLMALQPDYAGSAAADLAALHGAAGGVAVRFFERQGLSVPDLVTPARAALLRRHPYPLASVPTVVVRTSFKDRPLARPRGAARRSLWLLQKRLERAGVASDGVTSLEAQRIPGAPAEFTLEDMDHLETCVRGEGRYTPCQVTNLVIDTMLKTISKPAVSR